MRVLVIGGGIGGLCLAHGLRGAGIDVEVCERTRVRSDWLQGYRIHLNPDGCRALHRCLPAANWAAFDATAGSDEGGFSFYDQRLRRLAVVDRELLAAGECGPVARHRSVSRIRLRDVLLRGFDPDVLHEGREFVRYEHIAGGRVVAHFADGSTAVADLLVGADGSNSRVRGQYLPELRRSDTGVLNIAGRYPLTEANAARLPEALQWGAANVIPPRSDWMFVAAWRTPRRSVEGAGPDGGAPDGGAPDAAGPDAAGPDAAGQDAAGQDAARADSEDYVLWAYAAARSTFPADVAALDGAALRDLALSRMDGWADGLRTLVAGADPATVDTVTLRSMPRLTPWPASQVTLLGDAIHNMTPMAGIGANTALRDASVLRDALVEVAAGRRELVAAVAEYEEQMRTYANRAIRLSLDNARRAVSGARLPRLAFRSVLRLAEAVPPLKRAMFSDLGT